ncbi:hypothetical protein L2E82_12704 [Cichorium intybus]|uniref:Uncharacterized protein n=1 Tax=Cichorium intybus TaxID=13427 RepID=A0ACB9GI26_CICIN|nr:hypothetical protein L2E82_12704 [Cichorium intybus]
MPILRAFYAQLNRYVYFSIIRVKSIQDPPLAATFASQRSTTDMLLSLNRQTPSSYLVVDVSVGPSYTLIETIEYNVTPDNKQELGDTLYNVIYLDEQNAFFINKF